MVTINETLRNVDPDAPAVDINLAAENWEWKEGVEDLQHLEEDQIWDMLGLTRERAIPYFNVMVDPENTRDSWDPANAAFFANSANLKELRLQWHQLIGVLKMLLLAFDGDPTLMMDDVGLGKTIQAVALICMLAYFRRFYAEHGHFPGAFSECFRL